MTSRGSPQQRLETNTSIGLVMRSDPAPARQGCGTVLETPRPAAGSLPDGRSAGLCSGRPALAPPSARVGVRGPGCLLGIRRVLLVPAGRSFIATSLPTAQCYCSKAIKEASSRWRRDQRLELAGRPPTPAHSQPRSHHLLLSRPMYRVLRDAVTHVQYRSVSRRDGVAPRDVRACLPGSLLAQF